MENQKLGFGLVLKAKSSARLAFSEKSLTWLGLPYQKAQFGLARQNVGSDPTLVCTWKHIDFGLKQHHSALTEIKSLIGLVHLDYYPQ